MNLSPTKIIVLILLALAAIVTVGILAYIVIILPTSSSRIPDPGGAVFTQAAYTLEAQLTQMASAKTQTAAEMPPTETQLPASSTQPESAATPRPTNTPLPIATNTPIFTPTPIPQVTRLVTPTSAVSGGTGSGTPGANCNQAKFITDVSIPDGSEVNPGTGFTKTWRVENTGTCSWTTNYSLQFVRGDQMNAPKKVPFTSDVKPGQRVDLSVNFIAPSEEGEYESYWKFLDPAGSLFGVGADGSGSLWVKVDVEELNSGVVYDFVASACAAQWESRDAFLDCPGDEGDENGFVYTLVNPVLENRTENEPTLITHPDENDDGYIRGTYPAFTPKKGDRFLADVGCLAKSDRCDVIFRLSYVNENGATKQIGEWREQFDGDITRIDLDLSGIAGKKVEFVLAVYANGNSRDDNAFWLVPQILRD